MINMALAGGKILKESPLWGDKEAQESLQLKMFVIAVICIPVMLLPKPIILIWFKKKKKPI
jgi:V-type H+-transporting ATPase subunit a